MIDTIAKSIFVDQFSTLVVLVKCVVTGIIKASFARKLAQFTPAGLTSLSVHYLYKHSGFFILMHLTAPKHFHQ